MIGKIVALGLVQNYTTGWVLHYVYLPEKHLRFGDFPGRYLYHCHLLGHADAGMMATMLVTP